MINGKNIHNVRAIEKDKYGVTSIYRNAYHQNLSKDSKMETLSPLLKALGADLKYNIGPSNKLNIITEGITDHYYISAMMKYLDRDEDPFILPSAGARNINKLVSILIGWGCDFKILLDYYLAGYEEYEYITQKLDKSLDRNIFFVNCIRGDGSPIKSECKINPVEIETLISIDDLNKTNHTSGVLAAKEFYDKVTKGCIQLTVETTKNFKKLFELLNV